MTQRIAIITEHDGQNIKPVTWELFAFAKKMATEAAGEICFYLLGESTQTMATDISCRTGCKVIYSNAQETDHYHGSIFITALAHFFKEFPSDYILAPHSTSGMDYAPALSITLNGSCITGVEDVDTDTPTWSFTRSLYGGKIQASLVNPQTDKTSPLVLTLQAGACKPLKPDENAKADIIHNEFTPPFQTMIYKGQTPSPSQGSNLEKAEIIVSGGRGIEEEENYQLIEALADVFPRSATGASRPICDYGWAKYSQQIGATGTIISPKLYIACGISGATQHLEGIRDSRFIVAINTDPSSPIFQVADVCVIEDLTQFIPLLIETLQKTKRPAN